MNNTDFAIFLGQDYLAVSDFEFRQNKKGGTGFTYRLQKIKISVASDEMVQTIQTFDSKVVFKIAPFPFFDEDYIRLRALKALCLGTNVFIGEGG